jgi:hypothetical protein
MSLEDKVSNAASDEKKKRKAREFVVEAKSGNNKYTSIQDY